MFKCFVSEVVGKALLVFSNSAVLSERVRIRLGWIIIPFSSFSETDWYQIVHFNVATFFWQTTNCNRLFWNQNSLIHLLSQNLTLIHSFTHSLIYSLTHSLTHTISHSVTHSLSLSLIHSQSVSHQFTHLIIYSLFHSLIEPPNRKQ